MRDRICHVYILTNKSRMLYVGATSNLVKRLVQHRDKHFPGFTAKFNLNRLVYYEEFRDIRPAIARERQIKGWLRSKKIALIKSMNPSWRDLAEDFSFPPL